MLLKIYKDLKKINTALPDLWISIVIFGVICQVISLCFVKSIIYFSLGLWIGILIALIMAFHMAFILNRALDQGERGAQASVMKHNMFRYIGVVMILGIIMMTNVADPLATFIGIMGLKAGAYIQPLTHKFLGKISKSVIASKTSD